MRIIAAVCFYVLLSGCALVEPSYINVGVEHESHILQHFQRPSQDIGSEVLQGGIEYAKPDGGWFLNLNEGIDIDQGWNDGINKGYGGTLGDRDEFSAELGYRWKIRPNVYIMG